MEFGHKSLVAWDKKKVTLLEKVEERKEGKEGRREGERGKECKNLLAHVFSPRKEGHGAADLKMVGARFQISVFLSTSIECGSPGVP